MGTQTRKITIDTAALFTGRTVGLLIGVVRLNYLATYLGVANFGVMNFAVYFTSLFQPLFELGLSQIVTRDLARDPSRTTSVLGNVLVLKVLVVAVAATVIALAMLFSGFDGTTSIAIMLTTGALTINGLSSVFLAVLQAHRKMVFVSAVNIINDLALSIAIITLLPAAPVVSTPLILSMAVAVLNLVVLAGLSARLFGKPELRAAPDAWKGFLREGTQIAVASLGVSIYMFIGPSILRYARGDVEVGLFSAGYKFISIFTLLPATVNQVVFPIYSAFFGDAHHKLEKALADTLRVLALLAIPLAAGTAMLASKIFLLVYTRQYDPGIVVLQLMVMGNIFGFMDWVLSAFLLAGRRQLFLMKLSVATGLGVFLGGLVFIPRFGFVTLPVLSIATELSLFFFQMREVHRMGYYPLHPSALLKPILGALVMSCVLLTAWSWSIFVLVPLGAVVYFLAILILRGYGEQETKVLKAILTRIPGVFHS